MKARQIYVARHSLQSDICHEQEHLKNDTTIAYVRINVQLHAEAYGVV